MIFSYNIDKRLFFEVIVVFFIIFGFLYNHIIILTRLLNPFESMTKSLIFLAPLKMLHHLKSEYSFLC